MSTNYKIDNTRGFNILDKEGNLLEHCDSYAIARSKAIKCKGTLAYYTTYADTDSVRSFLFKSTIDDTLFIVDATTSLCATYLASRLFPYGICTIKELTQKEAEELNGLERFTE